MIGLSAARALREDGFAVTVYEQHSVGTRLGSSPGRSRIYRTSYRHDDYCRLARRAIDEWMRLDPALLLRNGLLEHGRGVDQHAAVLERCGEQYSWLEPAEAERLFPEARFSGPVLWTPDAGAVLADDALARLRRAWRWWRARASPTPRSWRPTPWWSVPAPWLSRLYDLPVYGQIEQVCFFRGAPDSRPSLVDHGGEQDDRFWYGVVSPGVGYKAAQDGARKGPFDPDQRDRPVLREVVDDLRAHVAEALPGLDPRAGAPGGLPLHDHARRRLHPRPDRRCRGLRRRQRPRVQVRSAAGAPLRRPGAGPAAAAGVRPLPGRPLREGGEGRLSVQDCDRPRQQRFARATSSATEVARATRLTWAGADELGAVWLVTEERALREAAAVDAARGARGATRARSRACRSAGRI